MPTRILATLLALALTGTASLTAPAAERTDYITQIKQPQGDASTAQDPLVKQTLNQHYPVNADASERLARLSDGALDIRPLTALRAEDYGLASIRTAIATIIREPSLLFENQNAS